VIEVDGDVAPAQHVLALDTDVELQELLDLRPPLRVLGQEAHADPVAAGRRQLEVHDAAQERVGQLGQDAGAVPRAGVGALGPAVLEIVQRLEGADDHLVRGGVVELGDHRDAARVVLVARVVQAVGLRRRGVRRHVVDGGG
jgi:hypothetical protein